MIIDQITLAGEILASGQTGYLLPAGPNPSANLAQGGGPGISMPVGDGVVVDVSGVVLQIERENLVALFRRQDNPIFTVSVIKEMFPGLFKDPYAHRVHKVAGFEDFGRGGSSEFRVLEVEGTATLVAPNEVDTARWASSIYKMPAALNFDSVAWDMPSSRLTPEDGFTYSLELVVWSGGSAPSTITLAQNATPKTPRFKDNLADDLKNVTAYQVAFQAAVQHEAYMRESHTGIKDKGGIGRPLLTAVSLLEMVPSSQSFYSLQEVVSASSDSHLFEETQGPPRRLFSQLMLPATLIGGESISLTVNDQSLEYLEAKLLANLLLRPPRVDKE